MFREKRYTNNLELNWIWAFFSIAILFSVVLVYFKKFDSIVKFSYIILWGSQGYYIFFFIFTLFKNNFWIKNNWIYMYTVYMDWKILICSTCFLFCHVKKAPVLSCISNHWTLWCCLWTLIVTVVLGNTELLNYVSTNGTCNNHSWFTLILGNDHLHICNCGVPHQSI